LDLDLTDPEVKEMSGQKPQGKNVFFKQSAPYEFQQLLSEWKLIFIQ
jgi:hypothetical protein